MNVDPRQNDPQYQSPLEGDSQRASQFGMGSQADAPLQQGAQDTGPGGSFIDPKTIQPGAEVFGTDGKRVGTVQEVYEDSFMVQKGIFFVHDYFIPLSFVTKVSGDRIDLALRSDEAKNQDWSRRPGSAALGRGVQANPATDNQQGSLNTRNNVNPTGLASGASSANPDESAGVVMPNQSPNAQLGMPMQEGLNPAGSTPTQGDSGQYDRTMNTDSRTTGTDVNANRLVPADQQQAQQGRDQYGGGNLGRDPNRTGGVNDDPYQSTALPADAVAGPGTGAGQAITPDAGSDTLSGAPREPRNLDDWDPSQQDMTNP